MLSSQSRVLPVCMAILFTLSCSKVNVAGPAGPAGASGTNGSPDLTGIIHGKVILYDSLGNSLPDFSNASIVLENTSPLVSMTSSADGNFTSPQISSGFYNLQVSKPGFGLTEIFGFQHTGGPNASETGNMELAAIPSSWFDIKKLTVDTTTQGTYRSMSVMITLAHPQYLPHAQVLLYLSHQSGIGPHSNDYIYRTNFYQYNDSTIGLEDFEIDPSYYADKLYQVNDIWFAAAIDNPRLLNYTDSLGILVYPAAGKLSNELKVFNIFKQ